MTKRIIDADALHQRIAEYSLSRHLEHRHHIEYVRSTLETVRLYKNIDEHFLRAIDYVCSIIDELATHTKPQKSIFDADGWCWDIDLAPKDGTDILMYVESDMYGTSWQAVARYEFIKYKNGENSKYKEFMSPLGRGQQIIDSCTSSIKAWRPLPTLPKDKL